eukprot:750430-Hanusia_phi.AAC.4
MGDTNRCDSDDAGMQQEGGDRMRDVRKGRKRGFAGWHAGQKHGYEERKVWRVEAEGYERSLE